MSYIGNAKDLTLAQNTGALPNMADTLNGWMQPMTFIGLTKTVVDFELQEVPTPINFMGVWIEEPRQLEITPSGQRSWRKFSCYAQIGLILNVDDVICYVGKQYRVMSIEDYRLYGYVHYSLVENYTGAESCP